jgi:hypothetical protein
MTRRERRATGLLRAAIWTLYLNPATRPTRPRTMREVARKLMASREPAVKSLVGRAGCKRLGNILAGQDGLLVPLLEHMQQAEAWAEDRDLPTRPPRSVPDYW